MTQPLEDASTIKATTIGPQSALQDNQNPWKICNRSDRFCVRDSHVLFQRAPFNSRANVDLIESGSLNRVTLLQQILRIFSSDHNLNRIHVLFSAFRMQGRKWCQLPAVVAAGHPNRACN